VAQDRLDPVTELPPEPPTTPPSPPDPEDPLGRTAAMASGCSLLLFVPAALGWLALRDRSEILAERAVGSMGPFVSLGAGLAVGLLVTGVLALLARYLPPYARLERRLRKALGTIDDRWILFLSLATALGEELLFRLAALDALGVLGAALFYAAINTGPGLWYWTALAFGLAVGFGFMVDAGLGLMSVTAAHAIATYLTMRRILLP